jgi:hypothetical protein
MSKENNPLNQDQENQTDQVDQTNQADQQDYSNIEVPYVKEELILQWEALARPFKKRGKKYFWNISLLITLISLILFFAGQYFSILALLAAILLLYIYAVVPPQIVTYHITNYGIRVGDQIYYWQGCKNFWIEREGDFNLLKIDVVGAPFRLNLVLDSRFENEDIEELFVNFMPKFQPPKTASDKLIKWWQKTFPFDLDEEKDKKKKI